MLPKPQIHGFLLNALTQRGYQLADPAEIHARYWFVEQTAPLQVNVDTPVPAPLGPYQAVHRLQEVSGTLRVQLNDTRQNTLWEGQIDTGLSPSNERTALLEHAIRALIHELPRARD